MQVAVTNAFTVFTWGAGAKGQLGPLGGKDGLTRPRQMLHLGTCIHTESMYNAAKCVSCVYTAAKCVCVCIQLQNVTVCVYSCKMCLCVYNAAKCVCVCIMLQNVSLVCILLQNVAVCV